MAEYSIALQNPKSFPLFYLLLCTSVWKHSQLISDDNPMLQYFPQSENVLVVVGGAGCDGVHQARIPRFCHLLIAFRFIMVKLCKNLG